MGGQCQVTATARQHRVTAGTLSTHQQPGDNGWEWLRRVSPAVLIARPQSICEGIDGWACRPPAIRNAARAALRRRTPVDGWAAEPGRRACGGRA